MARLISAAAALIISLNLSGCDAVVDCFDNDGPEFNKTSLQPAVLNQVYSDDIRASVNNEPQDQRFDYQFTLTGQLPAGISTVQLGQKLEFTGTPTESGTFSFSLYVEVDDGLNARESGLCYVSYDRDYIFTVTDQ